MLHISISAEKIGSIGSFPITNSLLATWSVMVVLFVIAIVAGRNLRLVPTHGQSIIELLIETLYNFFENVIGHEIKRVFPLVASLFLFILVANWEGLLPGFGTIGFFHEAATQQTVQSQATAHDPDVAQVESGIDTSTNPEQKPSEDATETKKFVPLLRGATADLNMTIALALIAVLAMQYFGFTTLGIKYSTRFFNFSNPIMFFVGLLEIISDISKVMSFAFRLFGNIFAGEVLLAVMAFLMPFIAPMPFLFMELFVGFIQAVVFSTLTAVFVNVAVSHEES